MQHALSVPQSVPLRDLRPRFVLAATAAIVVFAWLAVATKLGLFPAIHDSTVTLWAVNLRHELLTAAAWPITHLGGTLSLTLLTIAVCAWFLWRKRWRRAVVLAGAMAGSALLTVLLKISFARSRPSSVLLLGSPASSWSFPSGHSFNTGVFVGVLAGFVLFSATPPARKALAVVIACTAAVAVGLTRVYLAYHWFTDVLAGWSIALAWLCLVAVVVLTVWGRSRALPAQPSRALAAQE
ncbi:phosphatase PAP2 family protein [Actinomyces sp. MRS3W]|uniref:phosphatase PAP2 family protein n=1 Tax=Actinomyces sp. MRS3W TaxID=2800796 RepID=UPI0028FD0F5C|nr:phosphatase PAP2 family protein [Actinomyces sp. MRS3W]MDU0348815.1 phosphatase PAP2 family protein [Actinomyces sp. MRS3W]